MKANLVISFLLFFGIPCANAQIINGQDTLYGNEWINFDQQYFKIMVAEDGIYRIPQQTLASANLPVDQINGDQFQIFHNGEEVPIYVTTIGPLGGSDFIEFFGKKNTSELDRHLFKDPDAEMMNPLYSLFTDTSAYFLTWKATSGNLRYETIANDLTNLPPKEEYFMAEHILNYFSNFSKKSNSQGISSSDFGMTEGFSTAFANTQTITITPPNVYVGGPNAQLHVRYGTNVGAHQQLITLNDQPLLTDEFNDFQVRQLNFEVENGLLSSPMALKFQGLAASTDRQRIANVILKYPAAYNFNNQPRYYFELPASNQVRYLEIANFNIGGGGMPIFFDLTHRTRLVANLENGLVKIALPPSNEPIAYYLTNDATGIRTISTLLPTTFINYANLNAAYILLSNTRLFDDGNSNNWVQEYANYRASAVGGGYETVIVDIQQLYDQFAWGLHRHPLSIRNFAHFVKREWADAQYFFVVGKGREYPSVRTAAQLGNAGNYFVPTFGIPGSDNLLLAGSDGYTPVIPIGRIAVSGTNDIRIYLNKIQEFESNRDLPQTIEERAWMKRVMHLGGGLTNGEQGAIKNYLANMEGIIREGKYGGDVISFFKTSTDPIQVSQTEQIFNVINNGVSMISFFGHSGVGTFDFSIDNPDNFENNGKYPLIVSLGCYSGNIHTASAGLSERFNFFENKGTIAFAATAGQGYISSLHTFAAEFYRKIGNENYGEGIGDALQKTVAHFQTNDFGVNLIRQQFNYNGDPAIRLNTHPGPDYVVDAATVAFSPERPTTQLKSIGLSFDIVNLGSFLKDSIELVITQELPDGTKIEVKRELVPTPAFRKKLAVQIPSFGKEAVGFNRLYIKVDEGDRIEELPLPAAENNNDLWIGGVPGIGIYITDNSTVAIYPPRFGIVSTPGTVLKATTSDPLLTERMYVVEIDTTELFNSALRLSTKISQPGGVIRWQPPVNWQNNTVYYWRISPDSTSQQESYNWDYSSFLYLEGSGGGWNQSHFYQMKKNEFVDMELPSHGNLKYLDNYKDVFIRNAVNSVNNMELQINNAFRGRMYGTPPGMYVVVFDSITTTEWINVQPSAYGLINPNNHNVPMYLFSTQDLASRSQLIDFLQQIIPAKNYVLVFTNQIALTSDYKPQEWEGDMGTLGTDLFQVLEAQGANLIRNTITTGSLPYVFAFQKDVGPITEALADSLTQVLRINFGIPGYWDRGSVKSTPIGPAKNWTKLIYDIDQSTVSQTDTFSVDLLAYDPLSLTDSVLILNLEPGDYDLSGISALSFPFLKLRFNSEDSLNRTSTHLSFWRILYQGVPDFAINPSALFSLKSDTLPQGRILQLDYAVENLSDYKGDSLLIRHIYRDLTNQEHVLTKRVRPLNESDTVSVHLDFDTRQLNGKYGLGIELNPEDDQPELTRVNNFLNSGFLIETDRRNPVLDVTFDGSHIMEGDLVSSKPLIRVALQDENQYLALSDTSLLRLFLIYPDSTEALRRIYFDDPILSFIPANFTNFSSSNKAFVELRPVFTTDGIYQLLVQAQDVAGNQSGQYDFKVSFRVITKSMISNVLNYPNPFTTATHFVYTLTGSEPPARFKIQIMTISGRIVREITQDEIGPLKPGTHQTDFVWDGTDEFGDPLAKGVYLYRVLVQDDNGKEWEKYETGADGYIKNGFGKMVLLR